VALQKNDIKKQELTKTQMDDSIETSILDSASHWSIQYNLSNTQSFKKISDRIDAKSNVRPSRPVYWQIAASLLLFVSLLYFGYNNFNNSVSIENDLAAIKTIYLPDSSKVVLNANSQLSYSTSDWGNDNRVLNLNGQAYFEVKKGSKFSVITSNGTVSVLGTSFNVFNRKNNFSIECFTGKVKIKTQNSSEILTKGLKTSINKTGNLLDPYSFNTQNKEWINGIFHFYNAPVTQVFEELERQYNISIILKNDSKALAYTGMFNTNNLNTALKNICKPLGYDFTIINKNTIKINN